MNDSEKQSDDVLNEFSYQVLTRDRVRQKRELVVEIAALETDIVNAENELHCVYYAMRLYVIQKSGDYRYVSTLNVFSEKMRALESNIVDWSTELEMLKYVLSTINKTLDSKDTPDIDGVPLNTDDS